MAFSSPKGEQGFQPDGGAIQADDAAGREVSAQPPVPGRVLRVEVNGDVHDWFDVDELGDIVRSPSFEATIRGNIAQYFGVPVEAQAIFDDDGLLTTSVDFSRALQRVSPRLRIYNIALMGPELQEKTMAELSRMAIAAEQSQRNLEQSTLAKMPEASAPSVTSSACAPSHFTSPAKLPHGNESSMEPQTAAPPGVTTLVPSVASSASPQPESHKAPIIQMYDEPLPQHQRQQRQQQQSLLDGVACSWGFPCPTNSIVEYTLSPSRGQRAHGNADRGVGAMPQVCSDRGSFGTSPARLARQAPPSSCYAVSGGAGGFIAGPPPVVAQHQRSTAGPSTPRGPASAQERCVSPGAPPASRQASAVPAVPGVLSVHAGPASFLPAFPPGRGLRSASPGAEGSPRPLQRAPPQPAPPGGVATAGAPRAVFTSRAASPADGFRATSPRGLRGCAASPPPVSASVRPLRATSPSPRAASPVPLARRR